MNDEEDELLSRVSFAYRLAQARIAIDGEVFDPLATPYLIELYDEPPAADTVIMKGAQLGVTVWAILLVIERMRTGVYPRGVAYGFPTLDEVYDFAQARFDKMLRDNPEFFAGAVKDTDRVDLKEIGTGMLYFRGVNITRTDKRPTKLLSFPADALVLDEFDDMHPRAIDVLMSRLDSSKIRHIIALGHPTYPNYKIAAKYEASDKRRWTMRCRGCNHWFCYEDTFPHCLGQTDKGEWNRCCPKCRRLQESMAGEWVAEHPGREARGYWMSQILSTRKPMSVIANAYMKLTGETEQAFWNLVMAKPHASMDDRLDEGHLRGLLDADKPEELAHTGPSWLGADVGKRTLHVVIGALHSEKRGHIHWIGEVKTFDELFDLGKKHNVQTGVIDAMAETRSVTDFTRRSPWAWGCQYVDSINSAEYSWVGQDRIVKVNRTASMDASHRAMRDRQLTFRRSDPYASEFFIPQMVNLVRVRVANHKTGDEKAFWVVPEGQTKNDHFRHAVNYGWIASTATSVYDRNAGTRRSRDDRPSSWLTA